MLPGVCSFSELTFKLEFKGKLRKVCFVFRRRITEDLTCPEPVEIQARQLLASHQRLGKGGIALWSP